MDKEANQQRTNEMKVMEEFGIGEEEQDKVNGKEEARAEEEAVHLEDQQADKDASA